MDNTRSCRPHLWEIFLAYLIKKYRKNKFPLLCSICFGIAAHGFVLTNRIINHDEAFSMFTKGATISSGRWGLDLMSWILPDISLPWIYGIMTILLIAIATCFIIDCFSLRNRLLQALVAGSLIVFPSLAATMLYMYTVTSYAVSFLLAAVCVWLMKDGNLKRILPALLCSVFSLSIYQSYIAFIASFLVLILIQDLFRGEDLGIVLQKGVLYLLFLVFSLGLYYSLTHLLIHLDGNGFNYYASSKISFRLQDIFSNILTAYHSFIRCLLVGDLSLVPTSSSALTHLVCILSCVVLCFVWLFSAPHPSPLRILFLLAMLTIFPLASFCMYLFTTPDAIHTLVLYSFSSLYVLFAVIADSCISATGLKKRALIWGKLFNHILTGGMAILIVMNIYVSNATYVKQAMVYENVYSFYSSVIADIKEEPGFNENTKLAIIGEYEQSWVFKYFFDFLQNMEGSYNFTPTCHAKEVFLEYFMDFRIPFATEDELAKIALSSEYQQMAEYPYFGSSKMIGNYFVIKLPQ